MSGICSSESYTCGATKKAVVEWYTDTTYKQMANREFTLSIGEHRIPVNKRVRDYTYKNHEHTIRSNFKYVISNQIAEYTAECYAQDKHIGGDIKEDYTTTDCTLHYVDLRNDIIVYTESVQHMEFASVESGGVKAAADDPDNGAVYGNFVSLATSYDNVWRVPFILEGVPITITNRIICPTIGILHSEVINSGYWDGIRVLMPLFNGGSPSSEPRITIDAVEYNPASVDWYYLLDHYLADGDQFFWWADWHKAVGVYNEIDAEEAIRMADIFTPEGERQSSAGVVSEDFMGSVAVDAQQNKFFSATFDVSTGTIALNRLIMGGVETPIPTEKIRDRIMAGDVQSKDAEGNLLWTDEKDSAHTTYFPIAPL